MATPTKNVPAKKAAPKVGPKVAAAKPKVAEVVPAKKAPAKKAAPVAAKSVPAKAPAKKAAPKVGPKVAAKKTAPVKAGPAKTKATPLASVPVPQAAHADDLTQWVPDSKAKPVLVRFTKAVGPHAQGEQIELTGLTEVFVQDGGGRPHQEVFVTLNGGAIRPHTDVETLMGEAIVVRNYGIFAADWHYDTQHKFVKVDASGKPVVEAGKKRK